MSNTEPNHQVVTVAYHHGRTGTSAMMGLLRLAGCHVGPEDRLTGAHATNPKGFFELRTHNIFLEVAYPGIYPGLNSPPSISEVRRLGEQHADAYKKFILHEFGHEFPLAIKAPRLLTLPFFHELRDTFSTRVLVMHRTEKDHIASLQRMWKGTDREGMPENEISGFLAEWRSFREQLLDAYPFDYLDVQFENMIEQPVDCMDRVCSFLDVSRPPAREINEWIDPSLANRDSIPRKSRARRLAEGVCHRLKSLIGRA